MNARIPIDIAPPNQAFTTVFKSGNSQAVRIPKQFQFADKRVCVSREGDAIVLRPIAQTAAQALGNLAALSASEAKAFDLAMLQSRDLAPLDELTWDLTEPKPATQRQAKVGNAARKRVGA